MSVEVNRDGTDVFVLTASGMVHAPTCYHVAHQVTEQPREYTIPSVSYEDAGVDTDGHRLVRERYIEEPAPKYSARYITLSELAALTHKYRRCSTCSPEVPAWQPPPAKATRVVARHLQERHLGRVVDGLGALESIRVVLHTSEGDLEVGIDEHVYFSPPNKSSSVAADV